jgi:hypothetical protein
MDEFLMNSPLVTRRGTANGWSFSKEPRFRSTRRSSDVDFMNPNSTLSPRSTSLGFGKRWNPEIRSSQGKPCPGSYEIPSSFTSSIGPKLVKTSIQPLGSLRHLTPGPGTYNSGAEIGRNSPKFSFRRKNDLPKRIEFPAPDAYNPKRTLTEFSAYNSIGFGYGIRNFPPIDKRESPGPGSYTLNSEFDRCRRPY